MEFEDMAHEKVIRVFGDLLKLVRHNNDVPEDQIRAIRAFCAYHGLLDDGYYSQMPKEELRHWLIGEFDWAGEKPATVEMSYGPVKEDE